MARENLLATKEEPCTALSLREPPMEDEAHTQRHGLWISSRVAAVAGSLYVIVMSLLFLATPTLEKWMCMPWAPIYRYFF